MIQCFIYSFLKYHIATIVSVVLYDRDYFQTSIWYTNTNTFCFCEFCNSYNFRTAFPNGKTRKYSSARKAITVNNIYIISFLYKLANAHRPRHDSLQWHVPERFYLREYLTRSGRERVKINYLDPRVNRPGDFMAEKSA